MDFLIRGITVFVIRGIDLPTPVAIPLLQQKTTAEVSLAVRHPDIFHLSGVL